MSPDECATALRAVADPVRLRILTLLLDGPRTVAEVARSLDLAPYRASRHLSALSELGVVVRKRQGRTVICALAKEEQPVVDFGCCSLRVG